MPVLINKPNHNPKLSLIIKALLTPIILFSMVFIAAGRMDYWQGWVYTSLSILILAMTYFILNNESGLIEERLNPGKGMKPWDKIYFALSTPFGIATLILAAMDAGRFHWSEPFHWSSYVVGYIFFCTGHGVFLWAKRSNQFFSSIVRIQTERNHQVCDAGPYQYLRHPGYAGALLFTLSTPVVLGSSWAVIPSVLSAILLIIRTKLEDNTLYQELPGYQEYVQKVKYRLVTGIW